MAVEVCAKMDFNPTTFRHRKASRDHLHENWLSINHHSSNQML